MLSQQTNLPQYTLEDYTTTFADRRLLHGVVAKWAAAKPDAVALLSADGSRTVTWREFDKLTAALSHELLRMGLAKGDYFATLLPLTIDHVLLEYACFRIGVIVAPLDLRTPAAELTRMLAIFKPRAFAALGVYGPMDFRETWRTVQAQCPWIEHQFAADSAEAIPGTRPLASILEAAAQRAQSAHSDAKPAIAPDDGALVIFTTGSTGSPKPALLSHRNITVQNMCISGAIFGEDRGLRALVHLPPSHVGCQTEILMTTLFSGGSAVLLEIFEATRTLRAIQQHKVEMFAQIPAMFNLVWMLKDYDRYDLSSLKLVAFGGNSVSKAFVDRVATMGPAIGTGLGLTECAGFCTYIVADAGSHDSLASSLGYAMPIYPCTIRKPMRPDGAAGEELSGGEIGHVCFRGPQTFLGYVNDPEATAKTISTDGFLYTGDLGRMTADGLHLTGRAKWVIKSSGHQIFPGDVEAHILALTDKVANCVVVGAPHEMVSEAVVALVEKRPGVELTPKELDRHARSLPPFMRPRLWILLEPGTMPLNRIAKPDHLRAEEMALQEIAHLRQHGGWDRRHTRD
jgi:acyl-CoA synthetase (AMP-forming)/AMP-acid ligase II